MVLLCVAAIFASCTPNSAVNTYERDGKVFGTVSGSFRHRWWNYYERAISYAEGQYYQEAISDLEVALFKRSKDQRMARTYGMHFVDYFPNRELGVILYEQGNLDAARQHLELSLEQFPSARAAFYLDRVRKTQIEQSGAQATKPVLQLDVAAEIRTSEPEVVISGQVSDPNLVSDMTINSSPLFFGTARESFPFSREISLRPGPNKIVLEAVNLLGGTTQRTIDVVLDQNGPLITIEKFDAPGKSGSNIITLSGTAFDEAGIESLVINGQPQSVDKNREVSFIYHTEESGTDLEIRCRDSLGNESVVSLSQSDEKISRAPVQLAAADSSLTGLLIAEVMKEGAVPGSPAIRLKDWDDEQTVFLDRVFIEGEASDDSSITDLTMNGRQVFRQPGKQIFFNGLVDLDEGKNEIVISTTDDAGNTVTRSIVVIREIPSALQLEERLSLTVLPFDLKGDISPLSDSFLDELTSALFARNRFRIIEREKLDFILQEQKLSRTDLVDRRTAIRLGKLIAAEAALTGSIVESPQGYEIVTRLIDTETSEILAVKDVYDEGKDSATLRELAEGLALKVHRDFPLLTGSVISLKGKSVFIDLGKDKTKLQRRFILFREEPILHPVTGKQLGSDNIILARGRVSQVMDELSKVNIEEDPETEIQALDRVITE